MQQHTAWYKGSRIYGGKREQKGFKCRMSRKETLKEIEMPFPTSSMTVLGTLAYGQTTGAIYYHLPPKYRAFKFTGNKGDSINVAVRSEDGDPIAWVLDNAFNILAYNDDANATTSDALLTLTLPGNANSSINTYYIVFREYYLAECRFVVQLSKTRLYLRPSPISLPRRPKPWGPPCTS